MTTEDKREELEKVAKKIAATGGGPLKAAGVNPVPGEGNPDADILFIGEAPGFNENEQQRPFVGQAGKLLRKTLDQVDIPVEQVYITNIVKFRPPENRDPTPEEIEFFKPFLDEQIKIIDPQIIVTLGRYSMYKFFGDGVSISKIHGHPRAIEWEGKEVTVFPMYHPAAALRQGSVMNEFIEDFKKLAKLAMGETETNNPQAMTEETKSPKKSDEQLKLI